MIECSREGLERELAAMNYVNPAGSTVTGMGDSFQQFGYWGCLFFAALALVFGALWRAAAPHSALFAQLLYLQSCTSAMRAVTHWTLDFLPGFLYSVIFLGLAVWYARLGTGFETLPGRARSPAVKMKAALGNQAWSGLPARLLPRGSPGGGRLRAGMATPHFPKALATMKISTAPPKPPPSSK